MVPFVIITVHAGLQGFQTSPPATGAPPPASAPLLNHLLPGVTALRQEFVLKALFAFALVLSQKWR